MRRREMRLRGGDVKVKSGEEIGRKKIETKVLKYITYSNCITFYYR